MSSNGGAPLPLESQAPTVKGVIWTMSMVPLVFVLMRLYVRVYMRRVFGWDDGIAIAAICCLVAYAAVCHVAANLGLGQHLEIVQKTPNNLIQVALLCNIGESLAIMACTLGKTSFAVTLLRIVVQRWMVVVLWFVIVTMNIVNILAALFVFLQCKDPRHLWNPMIPSECWPSDVFTNFSLFVGAYSGAQDFVLALLPWTIVWKLQMRKKEKLGVAFAMSLGIFAGAASIVKTIHLVALSAKSDFTWELAPLLIWAAVEDGLAITAASIPALKPLLTRLFPSTSSDNYNMIPYPHPPPNPKVFDNSKGGTQTDIGHTTVHDMGSQTAILETIAPNGENINMTTEVSVTYNHGS
ncbi:unnamed protein product [Penicillium nalgiovense]|uniref:Rhodopsin domain-containing protein n=1 Tax=Penicillium nalgiovense TaxID=60175 RepID=A0A1V6YXD5_PENNA|nr:hypothetical protein PENNAL_c0008G04804 [Penicillium nalgiovense]CAG7934982.1 unnamed protein product [Penicillium nalgiovense]CAG7940389.1 unnamed protein product [Penicillium nalgiovense]CAG7954107.1 unnamed protein product [Penicillium nalgiovense]CAG7954785.1 unnamed protein product [Penicillium nalgiovense]